MTDKVDAIIPWLENLLRNSENRGSGPFVLGLSGVQGSGKSTLVKSLEEKLLSLGFKTVQYSLDDFYKTFPEQLILAKESGNALWQTRGQFGTHDVALLRSVYHELRQATRSSSHVKIPRYDKSLHEGRGDRSPENEWTLVEGAIDIILLEGWGIGFQALDEEVLRKAYDEAVVKGTTRTGQYEFDEISAVNSALKQYNEAFMGPQHFDALVVLQAEDTKLVYTWRLEQEHAMWKKKGSGMTDDQVKAFIDRYYPSYELYLPRSVKGIFGDDKKGHQLNLRLDAQRKLQDIEII